MTDSWTELDAAHWWLYEKELDLQRVEACLRSQEEMLAIHEVLAGTELASTHEETEDNRHAVVLLREQRAERIFAVEDARAEKRVAYVTWLEEEIERRKGNSPEDLMESAAAAISLITESLVRHLAGALSSQNSAVSRAIEYGEGLHLTDQLTGISIEGVRLGNVKITEELERYGAQLVESVCRAVKVTISQHLRD
ncbi:MAG: hypothetical protein L0G23_08490 [Ruaniaceae bacterium]|nr:hypothetical protein [Ruaniaceae bacterium]